MKICMVTSEFPPKWGGVGNGVHFQSNVYAKFGYKVDIITREMKGVKRPKQHKNITIHEVKWLYAPMLFTTSFGRNAVSRIMELGCDYDVVHVHSNMALLYKKHYDQISSPIVSTMHGTWVGERSQLRLKDISLSDIMSLNDLAIKYVSPLYDKYEDYALSYSNAATVDSIQEYNYVRTRPGVKNIYGKDRIVRIPEGVDVELFNPKKRKDGFFEKFGVKKGQKTIISVARLAARKGVDRMIGSFKAVTRSVPEARLLIIGVGPQERKLRRLARDLGILKKVMFLGKLSFDDLETAYASADVFAWHSLWEGQGLVISESLAAGTPVVSTKVGGASEMIDLGRTGYYVPVGDTKGMAGYISKILKDDELRARMGELGRKQMEKDWSWQVITKRYDELYKSVQGDKKRIVR